MKKITAYILGMILLISSISVSALGNEHFLMMPSEDEYGWTLDDPNSSGSQYRRAVVNGCGYRCVLEYEFNIEDDVQAVEYNLVAIYGETRNGSAVSGIIGEYFLQKNAAGWRFQARHSNNTSTPISGINIGETYKVRIEINFETNTQDIYIKNTVTDEEQSLIGVTFKEPAQGTDTAFHTLRLLAGWAHWDDNLKRIPIPDVTITREASFVKQTPVITFEDNRVKAVAETYNNSYNSLNGPTLVLCLYDHNNSLVAISAESPLYEPRLGSTSSKPVLQRIEATIDYKLMSGMFVKAMVINGLETRLPFVLVAEEAYNH